MIYTVSKGTSVEAQVISALEDRAALKVKLRQLLLQNRDAVYSVRGWRSGLVVGKEQVSFQDLQSLSPVYNVSEDLEDEVLEYLEYGRNAESLKTLLNENDLDTRSVQQELGYVSDLLTSKSKTENDPVIATFLEGLAKRRNFWDAYKQDWDETYLAKIDTFSKGDNN